MTTLSVLYIVRNEEAYLKRSLSSLNGIADETIVIDTGSGDKTMHVCRQFHKTRILTHGWVHDFSKARNHGLRQCSKEWVLYLDADEMLGEGDAATIRAAISSAPRNVWGFNLHVVDHEEEWAPFAKANPAPFFKTPQLRLFRRFPGLSFEGQVQESIEGAVRRAGGGIDTLDARIHHHLWRGKGAQYKTLKLRYYNKLGAHFEIPPCEADGTPIEAERLVQGPKVAIVVVGFNGLSMTKECLTSLSGSTNWPYELHFVDNGSTDGTSDFVVQAYGKLPVRMPSNMGVAKARNHGATEALRDPLVKYVCFLDNDATVTSGWLEGMVGIMEANDQVGMVVPVSQGASGAQGLGSDLSKIKDRMPEWFKVDEADRFCMVVRSSAIGKIGLFDDSFGVYGYEEKDFCHRVREAGMDIAVANRVMVNHRSGGTIYANKMNWSQITSTAYGRYRKKWTNKLVETRSVAGKIKARMPTAFARPRISIVIIMHNRLDMTRECVRTIQENTCHYELILVDNGSTDGTSQWLEGVQGARVIKNDRNLGVPMARNQGIRASTGDVLILMDNDTEVRNGWIDDLYAEIQAGADMVGIEAWGLNKEFAASRRCVSPREDFDYLGGACCMIRRKVFEEAGLLDEGFSKAYYEDVDHSIRAKKSGFKLTWKPSVKILHKEHATLVHGGQKDFNFSEQLSRSYVRFAQKMRGEISVEHEKLPPLEKKLKILYLGMMYDYGERSRGTSFEQDNFFPALRQWDKTGELVQFDFVELARTVGVPKMSSMLMDKVYEYRPDVMFSVFFNDESDPRKDVVRKISDTTTTTTIGWFCDSHWRYDNFDRPWADCLDFNVTTSAAAYERYIKDGLGSKTIKSQWAAAPGYHRIDGVAQDIGVSFVGQPHGDRRQAIERLRAAGVHVEVFGTGWGKRLTFDEMIMVFNRSKINLNLSNACDARFKQIKGRNFEVPGCGGFLLTELAENLHDYYVPDKEIVAYSSIGELPDIIKKYLVDDALRKSVADAAYARTMAEHTYSHRFNHIFSRAGLI